MGAPLPSIPVREWRDRIREAAGGEPLTEEAIELLRRHYEELRRWNPRLSLVGPGTTGEVVSRHYGEALAALPWVPEDASGTLVDIGSGAGFPGWVLAAARPLWGVTLVESQQRKWAFLEAVSRRAGLSVRCLDARVGPRLPAGFPPRVDRLTLRAVKLPPEAWQLLAAGLADGARVLWWAGEGLELPAGLELEARLALPGSERRHLWVAMSNTNS
jgi:16S rRNA (guanine527-N7)-methyltransferase